MIPLFVGSSSKFSGKNVVCLGLGVHFKNDGLKVGCFKPVGVFPVDAEGTLTDEDILFLRDTLEVEDRLADICPVVMREGLIIRALKGEVHGLQKKTIDAFKRIADGKDVVLINGLGNLHHGMFLGCGELDFIKAVGACVILTDRFGYVGESVDNALAARQLLGDSLLGIIVNRIAPGKVETVRDLVTPFLEKHGVPVLGILEEDPVLSAVSVGQLMTALDGDLLCCEEKLGELVERFSIGAMNEETALRYFRRVSNKAVITGGDRADIQLAALETSTKCLILTGDLYPDERIVARAEEVGVPIMVVKDDTGTTVDKCDAVMGQLSIRDEKKLGRAVELVENSVDIARIYAQTGLKR